PHQQGRTDNSCHSAIPRYHHNYFVHPGGLYRIFLQDKLGFHLTPSQGRTENLWGPRAIGDHWAPVSLPKLKKAYEKGTRGISWGPLLTPGPRAVAEFPNGQSAPAPSPTIDPCQQQL
ncbi:unnamed protein product, partial [Staurois parvus]